MRMPTSAWRKSSRSLSPTASIDPLEVELRRERRLHAVDDRELGGALLGLLQQALRLVEEARVLQRDAHAGATVAQQATSAVAEGVLALRGR